MSRERASRERIALYTTVYPGVERYLGEWWRSVAAQSDQDFDLWIGADGLDADGVYAAMGARPAAEWVFAEPGDSFVADYGPLGTVSVLFDPRSRPAGDIEQSDPTP